MWLWWRSGLAGEKFEECLLHEAILMYSRITAGSEHGTDSPASVFSQ
jgi:hypothetical protein